jgi:hypothetical protein
MSTSNNNSLSSWIFQNTFAFCGVMLIITQLAVFHVGMNVLYDGSMLIQHSQQRKLEEDVSIIDATDVIKKTRQSRKKTKHFVVNDENSDGTFVGYPIYFRENEKGIETLPHCVGENYQQNRAWMHRSCEFSFICFDITTKDYVVFQSPEDEQIYKHVELRPFLDISQSYLQSTKDKKNTVSLGGINLKWSFKNDTGIPRLEWFPEIRKMKPDETLSYYELPPSVVMVPFHSMNGANPGHLVWDDFLPIYTLLTMFQLEKNTDLLMMRYILKDGVRGLWASCDFTDEKKEDCKTMQRKFLPLMIGADPVYENMPTTEEFTFEIKDGAEPRSNLICAQHGLAGIGALTDHGTTKYVLQLLKKLCYYRRVVPVVAEVEEN